MHLHCVSFITYISFFSSPLTLFYYSLFVLRLHFFTNLLNNLLSNGNVSAL